MNSLNYLEYGLIVGYKAALLEARHEITFTTDYGLDVEFIELTQQLIKEFQSDTSVGNYFSEYVERRLLELDKEKKHSA